MQDYWIGASNVDDNSVLSWVDGTTVNFDQLPADEELDTSTDQCIEVVTTLTENNWRLQYCGKPRAFICAVPVGTRVYIPDDVHNDYKCDTGWHFFSNNGVENCYKISDFSQTWLQGQRRCQELESELVSVGNTEENEFIAHLLFKKMRDNFAGDAWIGLKTTKVGGDAIVDSRV